MWLSAVCRDPAFLPTSMHMQLFAASCGQFDKLRKKEAFLDQFRKQPMFSEDLSELDDSRCSAGGH